MNTLPTLIAGVLLAALVLGSARLIRQAVRTPAAGFRQPRAWRVGVLIALHALSAALLWLTLFPPLRSLPAEELTVFTAGADASASGPAVALPEAPAEIHAERVPDLASALRRHGNISRLHVIGHGLSARDREAAQGIDLHFSASTLPTGLIELEIPHWPRAGQNWRLRGRINGDAATRVTLLAPDDSLIDSAPIDGDGRFVLHAQARSPGQALLQLRLLDADNQLREAHAVPLATRSGDPLRVALRAGGSNAELKYLRRWIRDAGLSLGSELDISPMVSLREQPPALTRDALATIDVLLLDDRAWYGLSGNERDTVLNAARAGLGVLVLLTGEPDRRQQQSLAALGFAVTVAELSRTVNVTQRAAFPCPPPPLAGEGKGWGNCHGDSTFHPQEWRVAMTVRLPADTQSTPAGGSENDKPEAQAELSRRTLRVTADAARPLLRADDGEPLAMWRAMGRGRVALWWLTDSFRLVLAGASHQHANLWRDALSMIARPRAIAAPQITRERPEIDSRLTICAAADMQVQTPAGHLVTLLQQRTAEGQHCAGFWPQHGGWHVVQTADQQWPFYVYERNDDTAMQAWHDQRATARLATFASPSQPPQASATTCASPFPYALAWLLSLAVLWLFERLRLGHRALPQAAAPPN